MSMLIIMFADVESVYSACCCFFVCVHYVYMYVPSVVPTPHCSSGLVPDLLIWDYYNIIIA